MLKGDAILSNRDQEVSPTEQFIPLYMECDLRSALSCNGQRTTDHGQSMAFLRLPDRSHSAFYEVLRNCKRSRNL